MCKRMNWLGRIPAAVKRAFDKNSAQVCVEIRSFCDRRCDVAQPRSEISFSALSCLPPPVPTWTNYTHGPSPKLLLFQNTLKIFKAAARQDPGTAGCNVSKGEEFRPDTDVRERPFLCASKKK